MNLVMGRLESSFLIASLLLNETKIQVISSAEKGVERVVGFWRGERYEVFIPYGRQLIDRGNTVEFNLWADIINIM